MHTTRTVRPRSRSAHDRGVHAVGPGHRQEPHLAEIDDHRGPGRRERVPERLLHGSAVAHVDLAGEPDEHMAFRLVRDLDLDHSSPSPSCDNRCGTRDPGTLRRK